ncbi:MAG: hypothetical protein R3F59_28380 [Myxococcota bacterium]
MSRVDEARQLLASWDPDGEESLPDWVADVLDEHPSLAEEIDAAYTPWDAGDLAEPPPAPAARHRMRWTAIGGLLAAAMALAWA